ncbi:MAG: tRNA guanosine(34) transglycosylase Tgt [Candidatus Daviesbacteria bacterium]|nr:MAG: tRNA guanosine(34) transglycosylase Tgt [Candidatus Daviesbacteria bacterium]
MHFKILHQSGKARVGKLTTSHGVVETPNFLPVATLAAIKGVSPVDLESLGAQVLMTNTYHLSLQPGEKTIQKLGGLHKFMGWSRPLMTDSGGFQVFSLGVGLESGEGKVLKEVENEDFGKRGSVRLAKVTEDGVTFQSHIDGSKHFLGPEESIKIQHQLGADLMVAFDDHESATMSYDQIQKSLELTEIWGLISLKEYRKRIGVKLSHPPGGNVATPGLYGVVHGGLHKDLRIRSAKFTDKNFEAIAIGGIYGTRSQLYKIVEWVTGAVSDEKVRHLLGIGEIVDLFNAIERGVDLFDCISPTRRARNGSLYVSPEAQVYSTRAQYRERNFTVNIKARRFADDKQPLDPSCKCSTCENFSRAYLNHLYRSGEILYHQLATVHNLAFIINLMREIRFAIKANNLGKLKKRWLG